MSIKSYINSALISLLLTLCSYYMAFSLDKETLSIYKAVQEGQVGVSEKTPIDNPFDNIFHVGIEQELCGNEAVWLTYELAGVVDHTAVSRSINDQVSFGGYLVKKESGWSMQREKINVQWLREGDNVIRFTVPKGAKHGYQVRNLSIEVGGETSATHGVIINKPSQNYYTDQAYVKGFVIGEGAMLKIDGKEVPSFNGEFEYIIDKPKDKQEWLAQVEVSYADGSSVCEVLTFSHATQVDFYYPLETPATKVVKRFDPTSAQTLQIDGASVSVPEEGLEAATYLSITPLRDVDIPALDAGMINVTATHAAYRFLPHGTKFKKESKLVVPYDVEKIPSGYTEKDIKTYYFDEQSHHWVPLPLDSVLAESGEVWSKTTHFTDMINGIIQVPESPEVNAYNSTSMKGIKAANPTAAVNLMQPPSANSMGNANMSYPLNLPAGRNGMQPQLAISYTNGGGNSWMGLGWNLSIPSITIDTRWGVPRYDTDKETETYSMNGQQLFPVAHRSEQEDRTADKRFYPRVEGAFNKIIRHGSSPSEYWWEVTDKSGTRYFYGGSPSTGVDRDAILADGGDGESGNIAHWCLVEVRDRNDNFVKYKYDRVEDTGLAGGSVPGYEMYCDEITYTGHGSTDGKYSVSFIRDRDEGGTTRKDVSIDARLGLKRVTADLLNKVEVKFNGQNVRHYEFGYEDGAFYKTLLTAISEYDAGGALFTTHELEYFDDVNAAGGYIPFSGEESWNTGSDDLNGGFLNRDKFNDKASALSGTNSVSGGGRVAVTVGPNDQNLAAKTTTGGMNLGFSHSESQGKLLMLDINGDGLSDKVMMIKEGGSKTMKYRPQLPNDGGGAVQYGNLLPIHGVNEFLKEKSNTFNIGLEGNFGAFIGNSVNVTKSTTSIYFSDVNGDGLTDIVRKGRVYFNRLDENGDPDFSTTSAGTPNPLQPGGTVDPNLVEEDPEELETLIDQNPLHDVVRMWRAPFSGTIDIDAPVALLRDTSMEREEYIGADGVKTSIQFKEQAALLWEATIDADDYSTKNANINNLTVEKGDRLYFRVQSIHNGAYDQVLWDPMITYNQHQDTIVDANNKPVYQFTASDDYLLASPQTVGMPIDGEIRVEARFVKPITTDSVFVEIIKGESEVVLSRAYSWDTEVDEMLTLDQNVVQGDNYRFEVSAPTNVDWTNIKWSPYLYYTASNDPNYPDVTQNGKNLIEIRPIPNFNLYAETVEKSIAWYADKTDTISVEALPSTLVYLSGEVTFSIKKKNEFISRQTFTLQNGLVVDSLTVTDSLNRSIPVQEGDELYMEFHVEKNRVLAQNLNDTDAMIHFSDGDSTSVGSGIYTPIPADEFIFGTMYRNWGMFVYNGNRDRANQLIDEDELNVDHLSEEPDELDLGGAESKEEMDSTFDASGGYRANNENFIVMIASADKQAWLGNDDLTYISADTVSSSRMGLDQLEILLSMPEIGAGATAIDKITKSRSVSLALSAGGVGGNGSLGDSRLITDYMDMNGDRYPDILSERKIQYTLPAGGLEGSARAHSWKFNHLTKTKAGGFSVSGSYPKSERQSTNSPENSPWAAVGASSSLSVSTLTSEDNASYTWMDINGDGLPDRINSEENNVALNLGYAFASEESWDAFDIREGKGFSTSGGLGVSLYNGSIQAGVGFARSDNEAKKTLQDVNGDGLPDKVYTANGEVFVQINLGNGFSQTPIKWGTLNDFSSGATTTLSTNTAFTFGIPLVPPVVVVKLAVNIGANFSQGFNRQQSQISDIDGDGFPDYLSSDIDSELKVKRSTIGRTNMLKQVKRPLGASFALDYQPKGSTYDNPNTIWTLSKVEMVDGFAGDGIDTLLTTFAYDSGFYERHEREFYGFSTVTTTTHDTGNDDAAYTIVTQNFNNDNYYEKGLMLTEVMTDAAGNKFVEKANTYQLKDLSGNNLSDSFVTSDDGVAFPAMTATSQKFYEGQSEAGKETSMTYVYNPIGNVTTYTDSGDEGDADDLVATIDYHDVDNLYIKSMPSSIVVESVEGTLRKREADIDQSTGNVTQIRQYLEDETVAVHDMEYDEFGNLTTMTRPANSEDQRLNFEYTYDTEVQTYVESVTNSYGYSSSATYDFKFGQVLESTDLNGQKITYVLDDLGRVEQITGPYEQQGAPYTIQFEYHPEANVPWALTKHYDPQNKNNDMETAIFVDGLGRVLQTKKDGAIYQGEGKPDQEMMIVSGRVIFDAFGRTTEAYYPTLEATGSQGDLNTTFDGIDPTITTYDVLNRALTVTLPDAATTQTEYGFGTDRDSKQQFSTLTTDANGIKTEQFTDVRGRVTSVKNYTSDGAVWTSFDYNAINEQIAATDDIGATTLSEYDWFGRRTTRVHPDAGTTAYSYDLAGNLTELVTANLAESASAISYTYDHERLTDITYPDNPENNVHYTYGEEGAEHNRAGRIVIQEDATGAQEFFYGPLGEVLKNIRTVVIPQFDDQTYVTEWQYDTWNRLESMIYADEEEVTYHYNVGGLLNSMEGKKKGARYNYVEQLGYDKFEQRVYLEYGNGTKTNYTYEPDRRRLKTMTAATAANRNFMDNTYEYDKVNNILSLTNSAPVPTSNLMGGSSTYAYEYDDLYRLTNAEGTYTGANDDHAYTLEMSYNTVGGITQKNQVHTRKGSEQKKTTYNNAYTYSDEQPHAPKHIGDQAYTYDLNGNQTGWIHDVSGQRREIIWDEENRIRAISDNGSDFHYTYDASGTRVLKGKGLGQSIYVNGKRKAGTGQMGNYTVYVNPYIVLKSGGYTKHYYIEGQRIVSKLGGGFDNTGQGPLKAGEGKVNYGKKHEELFDGIVRNQKFLAPDGTILTAGKSGKVPPGQIIGDSPNNAEQFQYFYHPDHLGSTSYITDASGEVYQHLEYFAFGETFVEEHSNTDRTPYLFNGKELDEETGLYYYGARYYDAQTSVWLSVDPLAEEMPSWSPYNYTFNNPIIFIDPTGEKPTPKEAALMANHVYSGSGSLEGGWAVSKVKIEGISYVNDDTGFRSALYERTVDGKTEYAYVTSGTDMTSSADWENNASQVLSGDSPQYKQSTDNARTLKDQLGESELSYTGHSLGGGLASANALATGDDAITFNAAGLGSKTRQNLSLNSAAQIDAYVVKGEIVDFLQSKVGLKAEGTIHTLDAGYAPNIPFTKMDDYIRTGQRVRNHMMDVVIDKLEE